MEEEGGGKIEYLLRATSVANYTHYSSPTHDHNRPPTHSEAWTTPCLTQYASTRDGSSERVQRHSQKTNAVSPHAQQAPQVPAVVAIMVAWNL